jgi:hypothetical protein
MALKALFGAVPDDVLLTLERALLDGSPAMAQIRAMIGEERGDRGLRDAVFAPVRPLFASGRDGPAFPRRILSSLWTSLHAATPELVARARDEHRYLAGGSEAPKTFDELCHQAAVILRSGGAPAARALDPAVVEELAGYIDLTALARKTLVHVPDWLGRVTEERVATLKIALRDASALMEDGAPRLIELMMAHLPEPQLIVRIISVVTDRASDRYLAESELARFGERLLADVERRVERIRAFDPSQSNEDGRRVGEDVNFICGVLAELERSVELSRDGPWGKRVTAARRTVAAQVEARLRDVEGAVAKALPMQKVKVSGRMTRAAPVLDGDPDEAAVQRARGLLLLVESTRAAAPVGGYGALRTAVTEKLRARLDDYADETLEQLNAPTCLDETRPRVWLELAAEFLERVDGAKSAQLVRRRAAAAGMGAPIQNVA